MKIPLLLIAMGFGYKIFVDATKEQGSTKTAGRLIGILMIVLSASVGAIMAAQVVSALCPPKHNDACADTSSACR